jgi:hypothetical protein
MSKKNGDKAEVIKPSDDTETAEVTKPTGEAEVAEAIKSGVDIDVAGIIKSTGGVEAAIAREFPMIEQAASQARTDAQRASAMAMREYRRRLHGIMVDLQGTIRDEGAKLAEQICARLTEQVRQAVLLQTEKKAAGLVDEFILDWQVEAETMSQSLLLAEPETEEASSKQTEAPPEAETPAPAPTAKASKAEAKKQAEAEETEASEAEENSTDSKVTFDFASFIARSKTPAKV